MKKKKDNISSLSNGFVLNVMGDLIRFEKGMQKEAVLELLGSPLLIEKGANNINEKMTFKIYSNDFVSNRYSVLFTDDSLVYIAKLT